MRIAFRTAYCRDRLCLLFAILAQIAANFGKEYYDFRNGIDKKGRAGFRRSVTEGEMGRTAMNLLIFALFFSGACLLN